MRIRNEAQREAARKIGYWPREKKQRHGWFQQIVKKQRHGEDAAKRNSELEEMKKRAVEAQMEAMKAIVGDLPTDLARGMDEAAKQAQADKKGKRIVEG